MKKLILYSIALILILSSCKEDDLYPSCLDGMIEDASTGLCDQGASVVEFLFQGNTVYVLNQGDCLNDGCSIVVDSDCNDLGCLGGIIGNEQINGESFGSAEFIQIVWEN